MTTKKRKINWWVVLGATIGFTLLNGFVGVRTAIYAGLSIIIALLWEK